MIRLIQRRLIVPRGDTGTFSIPVLAGKDTGDVSIFTIFDPLMHRKIFEKVMELSDGVLSMNLTHGDTVNLPVGQYVWDIKFYSDPVFADEKLVGGTEVDSYYAAFTLPICEIRETGDNLIMADNTPTSTLRPDQINLIEAALVETNASKVAAAASEVNASASALNAQGYAADALGYKNAALAAQVEAAASALVAANSATEASTKAAQIVADLESKANVADLAAVATSGSYNDLLNKPTIPSAISDLTDDSGHYIKPANGIPASDLEETYLTEHQDISGKVDKVVGKGLSTNDFTDAYKTKLDNALTEHQDISGKANTADLATVATSGSYNDLLNKPTNVSAFTNDTGYLTSFTETDPTVPAWAKAQNKPTYTASEVGAPTVAEMNTAIGTAIGNINSFDMAITQSLPVENINTHTIYLVPKTGETNDVYDEYVYINNAWEMIGNTQIDLSNYVQKTDYATNTEAGVIKVAYADVESALASQSGGPVLVNGKLYYIGAPAKIQYRAAENHAALVSTANQHLATFYGLARAAGDTTQVNSANEVGIYTNEAKTSIQNMLDVPNKAEVEQKAPVIYKIGTSPIIDAIPNTPLKSLTLIITGDPSDVGTSGASVTVGPSTTVAEGTTYTKSFDPIYEGALDFVSGELTITKAILDLGSIGYNYDDTHHYFYSQALYGIIDTNDPIYSSDMTVHTVEEIQSGEEGVAFGGATYIYVYDDEYVGMTINEFKAAVAGKCIAYTLRTPRIVELGAAEIRTLEGTTYVMSDDGTISVEYQVDTKSYIDINIPSVPVQDVQVNGTSVLSNGVANIPLASNNNTTLGVVKANNGARGIVIGTDGSVQITTAGLSEIKSENQYKPIAPMHQHEATFYGLAKAAGDSTQRSSANAVGTYTDAAKDAIQNMLGISDLIATRESSTATAAHATNSLFMMNGKLNRATSAIAVGDAVEVGTNCEVVGASDVFVKNTDIATDSTPGIVQVGNGLEMNGNAIKVKVPNANELKSGVQMWRMINPNTQHQAVFYGLSKVAGVDLANETVTLGTYPETSKAAIRSLIGAENGSDLIKVQDTQPSTAATKLWMLETAPAGVQVPTVAELEAGYVAKTDYADSTNAGVVKVNTTYGIRPITGTGTTQGTIVIQKASESEIQTGTHEYRPIVPERQHIATYYGLSKLAGVDLASETVTVGTYPDASKTAIRTMIGAGTPLDVQVNGSSIVSSGVANIPYANVNVYGLVRTSGNHGVQVTSGGYLAINGAMLAQIKAGTDTNYPIASSHVHEVAFYGLAKAAGDTTMSSSSNAVGTYTTAAQNAIQTMLGITKGIELIETVSGTTPSITGQPNTTYQCGEVLTLSITPPANGTIDVFFTSGSTATTLTVPNTVKFPSWFDATSLDTDTIYEIMITNGTYGSVMTWAAT